MSGVLYPIIFLYFQSSYSINVNCSVDMYKHSRNRLLLIARKNEAIHVSVNKSADC